MSPYFLQNAKFETTQIFFDNHVNHPLSVQYICLKPTLQSRLAHSVHFGKLLSKNYFSCKKQTVVVKPSNPWVEIPNLSLNSTINRLHAPNNEMLIATVDNFARMNNAGTNVEL